MDPVSEVPEFDRMAEATEEVLENIGEEILKKDVEIFGDLLQDMLVTSIEQKELEILVSLSGLAKQNDLITDRNDIERKMILNNRLGIRYWPVIVRGYYFPETTADSLLDKIFGLLSYLYWFWANAMKAFKDSP